MTDDTKRMEAFNEMHEVFFRLVQDYGMLKAVLMFTEAFRDVCGGEWEIETNGKDNYCITRKSR